MRNVILGAVLCCGSLAASNSEKMDQVFDLFHYMGTELKVDETRQAALFAPDFQMIINGKVVVDGRDKLTDHFDHLLGQVQRVECHVEEKIVADDKVIMRYDVVKVGKSTTKVIAIFKFRDGQVYEMNEVCYSMDPKNEIDFTSK